MVKYARGWQEYYEPELLAFAAELEPLKVSIVSITERYEVQNMKYLPGVSEASCFIRSLALSRP